MISKYLKRLDRNNKKTKENHLDIIWNNKNDFAHLTANIETLEFSINYSEKDTIYPKKIITEE